jgi:polygalacturonase
VVLLIVSNVLGQQSSPRIFDVRDFGATGNGRTLDTKAIQNAIDECGKTGGTVVVSSGTYLTGSLELRSNVELHLLAGATLLGSTNLADYFQRTPRLKSYNDAFLKYSLFYAEGQSNIAITGRGTIDGQGSSFKVLTKEKPARYMNRPFMIRFVECRNVTVEGVTLRNSASWMQHYLACEGVTLRGLTVENHANKNNDMMDIDGCRNVVVEGCIGDTDDDGITLKSTSERVTENVAISDCIVSSHCNAIKTGTESTGGFRNIVISNVVVKPSSVKSVMSGKPGGISGIALTLVDGGMLDGVSISNVVIDGPEVPIFVRLGNRGRKYWEGAQQPGIGVVNNITICNVTARNVGTVGCSITGLDGHPVRNISLNNIRIEFAGGGGSKPDTGLDEMAESYPESTMWGALPSYGLYVRHVDGIKIRGLEMSCTHEDARPPMVLDDVKDAQLGGLDLQVSSDAGSALVLREVDGLVITGSTVHGQANALFEMLGSGNKRISAMANDLQGIRNICVPPDSAGSVVFSSGNFLNRP